MLYFTPKELCEDESYNHLEKKIIDLPENVKLIGFRGEKGIGKSSFLKTFFEKNEIKHTIIKFNYSDIINEEYGIIKLYDQILKQINCDCEKIYKESNGSLSLGCNKILKVQYSNENKFNEYLSKLRIENDYLYTIKNKIKENKIRYIVFEDFDVINYKLFDFVSQLKLIIEDCKIIVPINYLDFLDDNIELGKNVEKIFDIIIPMYNSNDPSARFVDLFQFFSEICSKRENIKFKVFNEQQSKLNDMILKSQIYKLDNRKINNLKNMIEFRLEYNKKSNPVHVIYYSIKEMLELNESKKVVNQFSCMENELVGFDNYEHHGFATNNENIQWNKLLEYDDFYADLDEESILKTSYGSITLRGIKKLTKAMIYSILANEELCKQFESDIDNKYYPFEEIKKVIESPFVDNEGPEVYFSSLLKTNKKDYIGKNICNSYKLNIEDFKTIEGIKFLLNFISSKDLENQIDEIISNQWIGRDYTETDAYVLYKQVLNSDIPIDKKNIFRELIDSMENN